MTKTTAPYGTWVSPVTVNAIVENSTSIDDVLVDQVTSTVYHIEERPSEGGRHVLVNTKTGEDVFGKDWNARTGVHEYGGTSAIVHDGDACFSHIGYGRMFHVKDGGDPEPATPDIKVYRFADFVVHPTISGLIIGVLEDHTDDTPSAVVNSLCGFKPATQRLYVLVSGADFYASPTFSPDGTRIAWQQWSHPDMPWEGAEIHVADVRDGGDMLKLSNPIRIAGRRRAISVSYPFWVSNRTLLFTSDESGYQNPWMFSPGYLAKAEPVLTQPIAQDFGGPAWVLGGSPFAPLDSIGRMVLFTATKEGRSVLYVVDLETRAAPQEIECPYTVVQNIRQASPEKSEVVFLGMKANESTTVVLCNISLSPSPATATFTTLRSSVSPSSLVAKFPSDIIPIPQPMTLQVPPNNEPLHVVFYPPTNPDYAGTSSPGEKPPCVLNVHGGPTSMATQGLDWQKVFYTSRGWAWLDVNYGGSSGYGRKYVDRLVGNWGIIDVEDCIHAARTLSDEPYTLIDPARVVIRGGSAGGYTVLAALTIASDITVFAAGTSLYGISDLKKLEEHTHKFESQYLKKLVGRTFGQVQGVYRDRSPVFHADNIVAPLLILQGEIDRVVPKEQAEVIVNSINDRGGQVEYKLYEGEGHGWRQDKNIADALERELKFYEGVLKIGPVP